MRNIKLVLEYDGSSFWGFQRQPHHPTIQQQLEKALFALFREKLKISSASGRTDAGVHALGQVVNFKTSSAKSTDEIRKGLNAHLPPAIAVREAVEVPLDFHARFNAVSKTYEYRIWNDRIRSPLRCVRAYHYPRRLDLKAIQKGMKVLKGRHDFRSFCAANSWLEKPAKNGEAKSSVRTIYRFELQQEGALLSFVVEADGFLYHMVRNLVGTLLDLGTGRTSLSGLREILLCKDRRAAGQMVPSCGLTLVSVSYKQTTTYKKKPKAGNKF